MPESVDSSPAHAVAAQTNAIKKIVVFNVKFSPNLGDGVIAACLEAALAQRCPNARIVTLDLAGRSKLPAADAGHRRVLLLRLLDKLSPRLREIVGELYLRATLRRRCVPKWRRELSEADCAVFGGGQLIQDQDLNFPVKLAVASREAQRHKVPCGLYAVGAARETSRRARTLFARLINPRLIYASARDRQSAINLEARGATGVVLAPDPALLAAMLWPRPPPMTALRLTVGVCITHPAVLRHHGSMEDPSDLITGYERLIADLLSEGYDVACFTNGAYEDDSLLQDIFARVRSLDASGIRLVLVPRPTKPDEVARIVAACDGIIAHRLHACILAYAYRLPSVGLVWDSKLISFFAETHRSEYTFSLLPENTKAIAAAIGKTMRDGVDPASHARYVAMAEEAVDRLVRSIAAAVSPRALPATRVTDESITRPMAWT